MLARFGLSNDRYDSRIDDGLQLKGAIIVNSVKCLPPQNKPTPAEIRACRPFFEAQLAALPSVRVIIALGRIAHDAALRAAGADRTSVVSGKSVSVRVALVGRLIIKQKNETYLAETIIC